ncbi:MAG TPA: RNA polymerase sigma factor [Pyrinomonadaceae bacterium]
MAADSEQHEEIFLGRYTRLRAWALQLTENDRERAEDLVHDAYIQFTFTRPNLNAIANLDGYLYTMLRNLHLSQVRRLMRLRHRSLSIVDYDSAEMGLRASDPREQIRLQDELRQICHYASMRKETSKAGSVLILRFLHGYYPREIAEVMRSTREAVEERLRVARNEARQYLENPKSLRFLRESTAELTQSARAGFARTTDEFLQELRQSIFNSRRGDCPASGQLKELYLATDATGIEQAALAHIVSCPKCLDEVNGLLNLPLLAERFPTDTLGTDTRPKGGSGGGGGGSTAGGASEKELRRCRRRAKDVLEHIPSELCISINGYLMAAQKVSSQVSEQTLNLNVAEKIDFVEIFSEQEVRLLFLCVEELPPAGAYKRSSRVEFSDERTLEATLSFSNPWPTLQVVYYDPQRSAESAPQPNDVKEASKLSEALPSKTSSQAEDENSQTGRTQGELGNLIKRIWRWFANPGFWLRPGTITAIVALILFAALLFVRLQVPKASAAELLHRSTLAEDAIAANSEMVLHRTINLEEQRRGGGGATIARHRIEVWQSAAHGIKLRRIYDDENRLVAGEWTQADGTSTVYRHGSQPQQRTAPSLAALAILETGELWRLNISARDFNTLTGRADALVVEERASTYLLSYQDTQASGTGRLIKATLTLNKTDLHAIEQTLVVQREGETREYKFTEAVFEQKPKAGIPPELFQPERELLGASEQVKGHVERQAQSADGSSHPATTASNSSQAIASPELEIEVTYLLNQIKANLGEQVSVTRTTKGMLRVEALVETEERKREILRALAPIINNPAVQVDVSTVTEAVKRQQEQSKKRDVTVREVEVTNNRIPADAPLRAYFSARVVGSDAIDEEINRYANRVMGRSRQALMRASALKRLVRRFSPEEIRALSAEARSKWLAMIREHAVAYQREGAALRQELRPIFNVAADAPFESVTEATLGQAADRLLQLSYANDETVRSAFTISADGRTAEAIKSAQFWRSLIAAEKLAAAIQSLYRD